ncbi:unnamed protein product [Urochloa decumbens]|uniref:F-box domain-containing protein n=1 Tax=Urochloa decumbens TaxID=240449 RepID=A0ABC8WJP3_9POAL
MGQVQPVPRGRDSPVPPLPDALIEEIVVRIATPRDLVRVSAVCSYFRRLVADDSFLRRYRTLHPSKLLLGIVSSGSLGLFVPAEAPQPNVLIANAFARAADFSPDYLPPRGRSGWFPCDARDGRILLKFSNYADPAVLPELDAGVHAAASHTREPNHEDAHFRVIGWTFHLASAVVFVYSSLSGTWTAGTRAFWSDLGLDVYNGDIPPEDWWPSYAYGCFYWKVPLSNELLKLDVNRMEFSAVGLPPNHEERSVVVAEAGEGRFGILSRIHYNIETSDSLHYSIRQNEGEIANQHTMETTIALPSVYNKYIVVAAAEGYFFLLFSRFWSRQVTGVRSFGCSAFFTLEIKTLKVERVCSSGGHISSRIFPYFGFPPFMSPRRI